MPILLAVAEFQAAPPAGPGTDMVPATPAGQTPPVTPAPTAPEPTVPPVSPPTVPGSPPLQPAAVAPATPTPVAPVPIPPPTAPTPIAAPAMPAPMAPAPMAPGTRCRRLPCSSRWLRRWARRTRCLTLSGRSAGATDYQRIKLQQQQYLAQKLVEKARGEYAANQKHDAYTDYTRAADLDPQNQQAASGRDETAAELGLGQTAPIETANRTTQERIQAIRYKFNSDIQRSNENVAAPEVRRRPGGTWTTPGWPRNTDPTLFNHAPAERVRHDDQHGRGGAADGPEGGDRRGGPSGRPTPRFSSRWPGTGGSSRTSSGPSRSLIQSARQYQEQGQYRQALAAIDQIQRVDPSNQYALGTRQLVLDKATGQEQKEYFERFDREFEHQLNAAFEAEIPYSDIVHYSDDWPTLSEQRDQEVKADRGEGDQGHGPAGPAGPPPARGAVQRQRPDGRDRLPAGT